MRPSPKCIFLATALENVHMAKETARIHLFHFIDVLSINTKARNAEMPKCPALDTVNKYDFLTLSLPLRSYAFMQPKSM